LRTLTRFLFLFAVKTLSRALLFWEWEWVGTRPKKPFRRARIVVFLNHTSLFEPVFLALVPTRFLWAMAARGLIPGADSTLDRPLAGRFFKWMAPEVVSVTRNRDQSWRDFMARVHKDTIVIMSPEGRMKRRNGLDKYGRPMTMRGGIADVLEKSDGGTMLILYSGGLHHVQAPGEGFPHLFRLVRARFEEVPIPSYKEALGFGAPEFRKAVMADLERRRDKHCHWDVG
jgi:hypothetical protein